jgi:hypothetical protein
MGDGNPGTSVVVEIEDIGKVQYCGTLECVVISDVYCVLEGHQLRTFGKVISQYVQDSVAGGRQRCWRCMVLTEDGARILDRLNRSALFCCAQDKLTRYD